MSYQVTHDQFRVMFKSLAKTYRIYGPSLFVNKAEVSGHDYVGYRELSSYDDLITNRKSYFSPKETVFPAREVLFTFDTNGATVPLIDEKPVIIFLRACDMVIKFGRRKNEDQESCARVFRRTRYVRNYKMAEREL